MKTKVSVQKSLVLTNAQIANLLKMPKGTTVTEESKYDYQDEMRTQTGLKFTWTEEEEREV